MAVFSLSLLSLEVAVNLGTADCTGSLEAERQDCKACKRPEENFKSHRHQKESKMIQ